ncbi:LON peptidase substrate-binding domain-containing protein [Lewinella sp. IMCC34183]|uniref:LON peptidase substrate-binding domain-containing protein n=1 Tax=Lewinella sp. IMCC34183 TaxID=2248762 RepID=UPI000E27FD0A|nr:LON peptidase substrate-binding domain-containing protein [Lewinella sp. IMCC34183]
MQSLALFPLQLVVFPGETLNLHIFEPRYRKLIQDAEGEGITFGVPTVMEGDLRPLATEVRLTEVARRYPDGESDIRAVGERVFRIDRFYRELPDKPYPGADVTFLPREETEDVAINARIVVLTRDIYRKLNIKREVPSVAAGFRTYDVAHYVGFTLEQEYTFLTLLDATERQRFLLEHLEQVDPRLGEGRRLQARAEMNGHFQNLKPPNF